MTESFEHELTSLRGVNTREEDVLQTFGVSAVSDARTIPLQECDIRDVRQGWSDDFLELTNFDHKPWRVGPGNDEACLLRISDKIKPSVVADRLCTC